MLATRSGRGAAMPAAAESTPNRRQATAMPTAATATLARISTPSMPNSCVGLGAVPCPRICLGLLEDRLQPVVDPAVAERQPEEHAQEDRRDRQQDERDGHHRGDSWILSQTAFGPRNEPQNVMPISRNM